MPHPITIENDLIRLEVRPRIGGKVSSIIDKRDKYELLFNYPAELPLSPQYDVPYSHGWYAGWDECFPAIAAGPYVGHPYSGINIPDHGELWGIPTTATPSKDGITTVWHGLRFGYQFTRKLTLEGDSIVAQYNLINFAPFEFHFVWAMHCLLSMNSPVELELPSTTWRLSHDAKGHEIQKTFTLGEPGELQDLQRPGSLPPNQGWKVYSVDPISNPVAIRYPGRPGGRSLRLQYASEDHLVAFWSIWINTGGWEGHHHFAIEPTTGRFDQLERSVRDGSAGSCEPSGKLTWSVHLTLA